MIMTKYPTYKESGIQWIGAIPNHWEVGKLVWLLEHITTGLNPRANFKFTEDGEYYYVTIANFKNGQLFLDDKCDRIDKDAWDIIQKRSDLQVGDILFASISKDGQAYVVNEIPANWNINESVFKLRFKKDLISPRFAYYILTNEAYYNELRKDATGSTFQSIKQNKLKLSTIPVPPFAEQEAIAAYLDDKTAKIDECVKLLGLQKSDLQKFNAVIITEVISHGINHNAVLKDSGVSYIGQIPESWKVGKIKYCGEVFGRIGFRGYTVADMVSAGEGAIALSPSNIKDNKMSFEKLSYVSWAKYEESPEIQIQNGDILLTKTGSSYGKSAYVEGLPMESTINPQLVVIKNICENAKFLAYVMETPIIQQQVEDVVSGGTIPTMAQKDINNFSLPLPPLSEQQEIVDYLDSKTAKIDEAIRRIDEQLTDLRAYRTSLISEVVTGKIDVRNV